VDADLARTAADLASRFRLRGADAIYIAAASTLGLPLVTWDVEQRQRAARVIDVVSPENRR
jgi:predicted nucleic acid-binding protein